MELTVTDEVVDDEDEVPEVELEVVLDGEEKRRLNENETNETKFQKSKLRSGNGSEKENRVAT